MSRLRDIVAALLAFAAFGLAPAQAEKLIVSISNHRVTVTSSYSGEELVLFGSVERDAATPVRHGGCANRDRR